MELGLGREWGVTLQPGDSQLHLPVTPLTPAIITTVLGILTAMISLVRSIYLYVRSI